MPATIAPSEAPSKDVLARQGERTANQSPGRPFHNQLETLSWSLSGGNLIFSNGGTWANPMAYPGWNSLYTGTYRTYRWMLQHPIVRLVRSIATDIIVSSTWDYVPMIPEDDIPKSWIKLAKLVFDPLRIQLIKDFFVPGRDMGWRGGEPIWEERDGRLHIRRVKPLVHEATDILQDDYGNIIGLRNNVSVGKAGSGSVELEGQYKSFIYTYDGDAGNPYGRSWLENIRMTAWRDWLDCSQQLARLGAKISGVVTIVKSPAGTFPGPAGADGKPTAISYRDNAETVIKSLANGAAGVWFPSLALVPDARGGLDAMKVLVELAGKSLTSIEVVDFGSNAAAIGPILERMKHAEELIFAGGLRSSRTGLEGTHGTKEEAGVHTDTGTITSEAEDEDFANACQPLMDALMVVNFGEKARGRVKIKPPSLVDRKAQVLRALLLQLMNHPQVNAELARTLGINKILETLDAPTIKDFDPAAIKEETKDSSSENQPAVKNPEPQGGRPKKEE